MMQCLIHHAQVAAQAAIATKDDQHHLPPTEEVIHTVEDAARPNPHRQLEKIPTTTPHKTWPNTQSEKLPTTPHKTLPNTQSEKLPTTIPYTHTMTV
jgi:hypothetical protein